jgi:shikimate kinase
MDAYYDYHPLLTFGKHLVLAGYIGAETRQIGHQLASLTGLPVADLDRKIEHHAGKSVWELIWGEGEGRYRELEREHLPRLLVERPYSIVTLGDGTLIDPANRRQVLAETHLVVLDLDLPNCYWRLKAGPTGKKDHWHPLHPDPLEHFEQVKPYHRLREAGFRSARHRIGLRGQKRGTTVETLMELIPRL